MERIHKKMMYLIFVTILLTPVSTLISVSAVGIDETDLDQLVDVEVTVEIQKIRSLEKIDKQIPTIEKIDWFNDPDFYIKVFINNEEFTSPIWHNTRYIDNVGWSAKLNVPDDEEIVDIKIQLWDWNSDVDKLCDISAAFSDENYEDCYDVELSYSIKTGHWFGDDSNSVNEWSYDASGYGRLNGCDDGSIYQRDRDCELWFDIYQNDFDGDGIPYWTEVNTFGTDPKMDNTGEDADKDGIPIEWEYKWGYYRKHHHDGGNHTVEHSWQYNPFIWDDHKNIDVDVDGLDNVEEYLTAQWGSDPFRKDLFVELDEMDGNGDSIQASTLPEGSKELLYTAYDRQNIVYHLDDGSMGGGETIPFDEEIGQNELGNIYQNYFLHNAEDNWRRGVFHYGVLIYSSSWVAGAAFRSNSFYITSRGHEKKANEPLLDRDTVYASAYMHETGHTFGFNPIGGHDRDSFYPWQINWWKWRPYRSCMNYGYMYTSVDYSDGSRGKNDFDDWDRIDLTYFQNQ